MRTLAGRRPEIMLLASLAVFAAVLLGRAASGPPPQVALSPAAPAPAELGDEQIVARLQDRVRRNPNDIAAYEQLGAALIQRARETADPTLYPRAEQAFAEALKRDPGSFDALIGQGTLALSRHQFAQALQLGEQAHAANPYSAAALGIIGDAQVELGQYDAAADTFQKMVDTRPDLRSYSRVSYIRELRGDTAGAIDAMGQAVRAGRPGAEQTLWTQVQLGNLYFNSGDLAAAEQAYMAALGSHPDYVHAFAGIARVRAAEGQHAEAIGYYEQIVRSLPLPEFVVALGELYEASGQAAEARKQYDLVRAMQQLNAGAGMDVDLELALFEADHNVDPAAALERARAAYARRPSIYGADALAWALYGRGEYAEARRFAGQALRLGTRDAMLHYHAGMIALALGDRDSAQAALRQAIEINPFFSARHAPRARQALAELARFERR
jgi:tetratricopeptide (TPR) repeat protein